MAPASGSDKQRWLNGGARGSVLAVLGAEPALRGRFRRVWVQPMWAKRSWLVGRAAGGTPVVAVGTAKVQKMVAALGRDDHHVGVMVAGNAGRPGGAVGSPCVLSSVVRVTSTAY